ncbi:MULTISPECIES: hypothetical protein [unclassified Lysobacter]|uniref:hypothetical protein n=1 Tax=unclassified Lysobacter TaxID=2635362 RepID=UPI001C247375|nr:hypothetical protein [Lysobacter sp. MMG2]MBU8977987.1 hypothetical protein [Lysobacter sp. MMG2]
MNARLHYGEHSTVVEAVDMDEEIAHWMRHYRNYVPRFRGEDYLPALKLGLDAYLRGHGQDFDEMADSLQLSYARVRGSSRLDWDEALPVAMAAWTRLSERNAPRGMDPEPRFGFAMIR